MRMAKRAQTRVGVRSNVAGGNDPDPCRDARIAGRARAFGAGTKPLAVFDVVRLAASGWRR
jgi:hypothetical protein